MARTRKPRGRDTRWQAALRAGATHGARLVIERRRMKSRMRSVAPARVRSLRAAARPLIVAEGDSWFDYPFFNVLDALEHGFGYEVESVAHAGDTVEGMAYDPGQLSGFNRMLDKLQQQGRPPAAVMLSAGGNDIAGPTLAALLNDGASPAPGLNESVMVGVVDQRLRDALVTVLSTVTNLCRAHFGAALPILIHGYDYAVADGRGYAGGFWLLPGPWLEPHFRTRGYPSVEGRKPHMKALIDRFNAMAARVAGGPGLAHVDYVDLRGTLSGETAGGKYKRSWANELHPTRPGFSDVAARFDRALRAAGV